MTRLLIVPMLVATLTAIGCSDNGGNGTGLGGSGGGAAGSGGTGSGGTGGGSAFMAVAPCNAATDYVTTPTTIGFGLDNTGFFYRPKCLKVPTGTQVTFTAMDPTLGFAAHPLDPSGNRGTRPGNPITPTVTGTTASFTFAAKGFWAYYCTLHGSLDDGDYMAGVIWAD
jgi:plastocyanin